MRRHGALATAFVSHLAGRAALGVPESFQPRWRTQVTVDAGRLDMVAEDGDFAVIFEHKVWSELGEGQLEKYAKAGRDRWLAGAPIVLITASTEQHTSQGDLALTWSQVCDVLERWLATQSTPDELVRDFIDLLQERDVAATKVSEEQLRAYFTARGLERSLTHVVKLAAKASWSERLAAIAFPGEAPSATLATHDGRLGLNLLPGWRPGLFVGALLDGTDHKVQPSNPAEGPDFTVILSFNREPDGWPMYDSYVSSPELKALRARLKADAKGWDFAESTNPWHPLHLRRPLLRVFEGASDIDAQRQRFVDAGYEGIRVLLAGGELQGLRDRLVREKAGG
jgi:hypothetical protein